MPKDVLKRPRNLSDNLKEQYLIRLERAVLARVATEVKEGVLSKKEGKEEARLVREASEDMMLRGTGHRFRRNRSPGRVFDLK